MSIATRIESIEEHIEQAYDELQGLGADLTNVNKNIENISMVLDDIYDSMPQVSGEGTSLTLDDTRVGKIKSTLKGNTSQSGTPTPTSPIPINVVSGDNEINVVGKNLFDKDNANILNAYFETSIPNLSSNDNARTLYIECLPNTTYTITKLRSQQFNVGCTNTEPIIGTTIQKIENGPLGVYDGNTEVNYTYTTNSTAKYLLVRYAYATQVDLDLMLSSIQIEYGSSASTYEPYQGNTYHIDLPEGIELCKIGNYQDYFYKDSDKWYLHKEIGKVVLNGTESYTNYNSDGWGDTIAFQTSITNFSATYNVQTSLCDNFAFGTTWGGTAEAFNNANSNVIMRILASRLTGSSQSAFKTWLGTHNVTFYYILSTPTNTEITYQPLIDQLNLLEQATSKENQTIISQTNESSPFYLSAVAYANSITGQLAELKAYVDTKPDSDPYGEYSTTETKVGTFLGKPLYRKVVTSTFTSFNTLTIYLNINNLKRIYNISGVVTNIPESGGQGNVFIFPSYRGSNATSGIQVYGANTSSGAIVTITPESDRTGYDVICCVEYTKTTD